MTFAESLDRKIPEYYDFMYLDGYSPEAILHAMSKKMWREYQERQAQQNQINNINITSEVRIRK